MILQFSTRGIPQPKGSARAFLPKGWTRPVVTSDNAKNKAWERSVAASALQAGASPQAGPLVLTLVFALPRPKSLKARIVPHLTVPDLDKLVRSVGDALQGIAWADDKQVVRLSAAKAYALPGELPGVEVTVMTEADYHRVVLGGGD